MNKLIKKRLIKLWDQYRQAEKEYLQTHNMSMLRLANKRLVEVTTRFTTKELLKNITDWDFPLWLRNDERITCEQQNIKRPNRDNLPVIEWNGKNAPELSKSE